MSLTKHFVSKIFNEKGAIFGIDARVSIAIFTTLSVTAGYFALGKIEKIRNASIMKEAAAIENAIKQMQTDMGVFYPQSIAENNGTDDFKALWDISYVNSRFQRLWNGPYLTEENTNHSILGTYSIAYYRDDMSTCETKGDCHAFIAITETPEKAWNYINDYVDGALGEEPENPATKHLQGKIRAIALTEPRTLLYKTTSRKIRK